MAAGVVGRMCRRTVGRGEDTGQPQVDHPPIELQGQAGAALGTYQPAHVWTGQQNWPPCKRPQAAGAARARAIMPPLCCHRCKAKAQSPLP